MWNDKHAIDLLEIEHPVIQAPMAGPTNPQLVAAVCEAGGLGGLGAAGISPDDLRVAIREIKSLTNRPFNVNLFNRSTEGYDSEARSGPRLKDLLQSYHSEMGLGPVPDPVPLYGPANKQLEVLIEERVPVLSFHFGVDGSTVATAKEAGTKVLCSATTVSEAILLEELGVDAIIAQAARWRKTMLTQVTFRSNNFPPYDDEQEQSNPGLWGKRLADYLVDKLKQHGIETEEIIAEDWGWYIPIKNEGFRLAICCGHQNGDDDEFLCFTDPATPIIRKLFKKIDATNELKRVVTAMGNILSSDPGITDIKWTEVEK